MLNDLCEKDLLSVAIIVNTNPRIIACFRLSRAKTIRFNRMRQVLIKWRKNRYNSHIPLWDTILHEG